MNHQTESDGIDELTGQRNISMTSFDRCEIIGLLLLMYGWWKTLSQSWLFALVCLSIGWLLAFATGNARNAFIRIVGGVSADVMSAMRSFGRAALNHIAEKRKGYSKNDSQ